MNATSSRFALRPRSRRPLQRNHTRLAKKGSETRPVDTDNARSQVDNCSPEKDGINLGAVASAVRPQRQQLQKSPSMILRMETLEARLRARNPSVSAVIASWLRSRKCFALRRHCPVSETRQLVLAKENECTQVLNQLKEAKKQDGTRACASLSTHMKAPKSILRKHSSGENTKSVTWALSA
jgi:hypothetical protein